MAFWTVLYNESFRKNLKSLELVAVLMFRNEVRKTQGFLCLRNVIVFHTVCSCWWRKKNRRQRKRLWFICLSVRPIKPLNHWKILRSLFRHSLYLITTAVCERSSSLKSHIHKENYCYAYDSNAIMNSKWRTQFSEREKKKGNQLYLNSLEETFELKKNSRNIERVVLTLRKKCWLIGWNTLEFYI